MQISNCKSSTQTTMKVFVTSFLSICCAFFLNGCVSSVQPIPPNISPITLDQAYTRKIEHYGMDVVFPAGIYRPNFQTERGVYYLSPTIIIMNRHPIDGSSGLFVPKSPSEKEALWIEDGWTNPTHRYTLDESIPFR